MLIGEKVEVPDECGDFCVYFKQSADMSSPCFRCPIFNCKKLPKEKDPKGIYSPMVSPENFSTDLAQNYIDWWAESQLPEIKEEFKKE